jgi:hypothetical protein
MNRATLPIFTLTGTPSERPQALNWATVFTRGNTLLCSGHGAFTEPSFTKPNSFYDYLMALSADTWCFAYCDILKNRQAIAAAIKSRSTIAVSDGFYKNQYGMAAVVIEGKTSLHRITAKVITPGVHRTTHPTGAN